MPNWCDNRVILKFDNASKRMRERLQAIKEAGLGALEERGVFHSFIPMPEELRETTSPGGTSAAEVARQQELIKAHGAKDWYDWSNKYWGCKWDASEVNGSLENETTLDLAFQTPSGPPADFYNTLISEGVAVEAYYLEPGMGFAGCFVNEDEHEFDDIIDNRTQFDAFPVLAEMLQTDWEFADDCAAENATPNEDVTDETN